MPILDLCVGYWNIQTLLGHGSSKTKERYTGKCHAICHYSYNLPLATRLEKQQRTKKIEKPELPKSGMTNFNFLTGNGIYSIAKNTSELESGKSEFSNLFAELNGVITQIRLKSGG